MKLIYETTKCEVKVGDRVHLRDGEYVEVTFFREPHKPGSSGHVSIRPVGKENGEREYYVGVIGARWVDAK